MDLVITRFAARSLSTAGALHLNGRFVCFTLEPPWKDNDEGVSCIPRGVYRAERVMSPRFGVPVWRLVDVPDREAVELHAGNFVAGPKIDSHGCPLLGLGLGEDGAAHVIPGGLSRPAFNRLMNLTREAAALTVTVKKLIL